MIGSVSPDETAGLGNQGRSRQATNIEDEAAGPVVKLGPKKLHGTFIACRLIPSRLKEIRDCSAQALVVIDDMNERTDGRHGDSPTSSPWLGPTGKRRWKTAPPPAPGSCRQRAAMGNRDLSRYWKTKSHPTHLGGEQRREKTLQVSRIKSRAGIGNAQRQMPLCMPVAIVSTRLRSTERMASTELRARFITICWIWTRLPRALASEAPCSPRAKPYLARQLAHQQTADPPEWQG